MKNRFDNKDITLSYIIPAYNAEKNILNCVKSISLIKKFNIEIIIINDGSTDFTEKKCREIKDSRIHIISQENMGVSIARNRGIEEAKGEYIAFADADDLVNASMIEEIISLAKEQDEIVMFSYEYRNQKKKRFIDPPLKEGVYNETEIPFLLNKLVDVSTYKKEKKQAYGARVWQYIYRREFLINNKIHFKSNLQYAEDLCFCFMALNKCKQLHVSHSIGYIYILNFDSAGRRYRNEFWKELQSVSKEIDKIQGNKNQTLYLFYGKTAIQHYCLNIPIFRIHKMKKKVYQVMKDARFRECIRNTEISKKTLYERMEDYAICKDSLQLLVLLNVLKTFMIRMYYFYGRSLKFGKAKINHS